MKFELSYKPLRNIFYWLFGLLILFIFFGDYLYELKYGRALKNSNSLYITAILFTFILSLPAILITIFYLKENYKTYFFVDRKKNIIEIKSGEDLKTYSLDEIESSIYHRQSYHRDIFWKGFFGYSNLGYLDLTFKNNDRYFLSCLLIDVTKEPIFENSKIRYSFLPFIDRTDPKEVKKKAEEQSKKRIEKLKKNFSSKTNSELKEMIKNKSKYQKEAIIAINELLENKNVG